MTAKALVQVRVDGSVKEEAALVLATMGLTVSDAVRLMLTRVACDKALPFDVRPNAATYEALAELEAGQGVRHDSVDELIADLRADG